MTWNQNKSNDQSKFVDEDLKKINSELTIVVLDGPGPIIGNTKVKFKDGSVTFDDIEFSEAGDYVLQIKSDNPDIEPMNIGVSIISKEVDPYILYSKLHLQLVALIKIVI